MRLLDAARRLVRELVSFFKGMGEALVEQSVESLQLEYLELEHTFLTLVLGSLVGLPLAPMGVAVELAPELEKEVKILFERTWRGVNTIADFFSSFGGEW